MGGNVLHPDLQRQQQQQQRTPVPVRGSSRPPLIPIRAPESIPVASNPETPPKTAPAPQNHLCLRRPHQVQPKCERQRYPPSEPLRQQPAAEGSLRHILFSQHASKRLYVHPLEWIPLHLSLLSCHTVINQLVLHPDIPQLPRVPSKRSKQAFSQLRGLVRLASGYDRDGRAREFFRLLGMDAQPDCQFEAGRLMFRYHQKPVCRLGLPLIAWHHGRPLWAYLDNIKIDELHERHKPRENFFKARDKRRLREKDLLISPFCMAVLIAMAQLVPPQQQVTLFLTNHEQLPPSDPARVISTVIEYTFKASPDYLRKFDQPYDAFDSSMTVHRRNIPLKKTSFQVLLQAVHRAVAAGSIPTDSNAEKAVEIDSTRHENTSATSVSIDTNKRMALDALDGKIMTKRVKNNDGREQ